MRLSPVSHRTASATFVALPVLAFAAPSWAQINNYGLLTGRNTIPGVAVEFDTRTNAATGSIPVGNTPNNAVFSPDGRLAYTANTNISANSVSVIDVLSRSIVATIPVPGGPSSLALSPNGQFLYTANQFNGTVSVINTATNAVTGPPITVGTSPIGVAASPDGNTLYVTNFNSDTVSVINATTRTVTATIPLGAGPYGVTVSPDGTKLYVVSESGTLSVILSITHIY